jgi:NhaA family Na+:H+ antiporter
VALDLRHWVNEGLMAIFFLVVGLEIKRELVVGELRDRRVAVLPAVAALGGMAASALIYLAINPSPPGARGWGIPMATDIAFAVGVLALLGPRVPAGLKVFLVAFAVADDVGTILIIAVFYSEDVSLPAVALAAGLLILIPVTRRMRVESPVVLVLIGVGAWLALQGSGVSPTLAGVAIGLLTPVHQTKPGRPTPGPWLEDLLHPWTIGVIAPLFALANAGVDLSEAGRLGGSSLAIALGVVAGRVVGKSVGISMASMLAVRTGLARPPRDVRSVHLLGAGALGGIGFVVALFVADLAFTDGGSLTAAKVGVIGGSLLSGAMGAAILARSLRSTGRRTPPISDSGGSGG